MAFLRRPLNSALLLLLLPLGTAAVPFGGPPSSSPSVPIVNRGASNIVPNSYIIKYKAAYGEEALLRAQQAAVTRLMHARGDAEAHVGYYNVSGFVGIHVQADAATVAELVADPAVEYVEADTYAATAGVGGGVLVQDPAVPGLVRLSHARLEGHTDYVYDAGGGEGITTYVVDTGINIHHPDFGGRAEYGYNAVFEDNDPDDDNGHGSHIAGIVGSATFGVAKKTRLVAVKVFDFRGMGPWSQIMRGMQWAADDAVARGRRGRAILNLSLGGEKSDAVNDIVQAISDAGIVVVVAAGNENVDATERSPASAAAALTVAALDPRTDRRLAVSNYGAAVDLYAPGVDITSLGPDDFSGNASAFPTDTFTGTSQATAHVSGICALLLRREPGLAVGGPAAVAERVRALAAATSAEALDNVHGTTGLIANNGFL